MSRVLTYPTPAYAQNTCLAVAGGQGASGDVQRMEGAVMVVVAAGDPLSRDVQGVLCGPFRVREWRRCAGRSVRAAAAPSAAALSSPRTSAAPCGSSAAR